MMWNAWSIGALVVLILFLWKYGSHFRMIYWISRQLPGPKYKFPTGNLAELRKYDHVCDGLIEWSAKYGPTFRAWLGPFNCVIVTTDPSHYKQLMVAEKDRWDVGDRAALRRLTGNSLLTSRNPLWHKQRSLMNPAFHFHNLRDMTPTFDHYVKPFLDQCEALAKSGEPFDISQALSMLTLDIIGRSAFGSELRAQDLKSPSPLLPKIRSLFERGTSTLTSVLMNFLPDVVFPHLRKQQQTVDEIRATCRKMIEQRVTDSKTMAPELLPHDLLGLLVGCRDEKGAMMPMEQMIDESMAFLLAGHETTSTTMTWLFYALATNPEVDSKLYRELKDHAAEIRDRVPDHSTLRQLSYLLMVIEETARMYPPIPLLTRQARFFDNDILVRDLDGKERHVFVPRGGEVVLNTLGVHLDEKRWDDALVFRPERFEREPTAATVATPHGRASHKLLESSFTIGKADTTAKTPKAPNAKREVKSDPKKKDKYRWIPFSTGPRHCIGQEFAILELRSVLSQILVRYRFTLTAGHPPVKPKAFSLVLLKPNTHVMMTVQRR